MVTSTNILYDQQKKKLKIEFKYLALNTINVF